MSVDFLKEFYLLINWQILIPILSLILAWYLNEKSKRIEEEYKRKEEHYINLLVSVRGFHENTSNNEQCLEFLKQVDLCWLYCPDIIIKKLYEFLDNFRKQKESFNQEKVLNSISELVFEIRKDLINKRQVTRTKLKSNDFQHTTIKEIKQWLPEAR